MIENVNNTFLKLRERSLITMTTGYLTERFCEDQSWQLALSPAEPVSHHRSRLVTWRVKEVTCKMCDAVKGHHVVPQTFQVLPDAVVPQDTSCCLKTNVVVESTYGPMVGHQPCRTSLSIIKLDLSVISFYLGSWPSVDL